jgi:hypothetical protein
VNRADFQKLAQLRVEEAKALMAAKKYSGAYYLAGYAVECAFKACIAKKTRRYSLPDKEHANKAYTHDLERLLDLAGLKAALQADPARLANWSIVKDWSEQARYVRKTRAAAEALLGAITDTANGVLPWIQAQW